MTRITDINKDTIKIDGGIIRLQKKLGLPDNFFKDLLEENDWSFIIKIHALIEGVCSNLLTFHFNEPKLEKIFSRLDLSDTSTGKLAFLRETELVSSLNSKYISSLSQFRNKLVHNVQYYDVNLCEMVSKLDKNQRTSFAIAFSPHETQLREFRKMKLPGLKETKDLERQINIGNIINRFEKNPKVHIWFGAYSILVSIVDTFAYSDYLQSQKAEKLLNEDRELP